jgi:hypothetical protein
MMTVREYRTFRMIEQYRTIVRRNPSAWLHGLTVTERIKYRFPDIWPEAQRSACLEADQTDTIDTVNTPSAGETIPAAA